MTLRRLMLIFAVSTMFAFVSPLAAQEGTDGGSFEPAPTGQNDTAAPAETTDGAAPAEGAEGEAPATQPGSQKKPASPFGDNIFLFVMIGGFILLYLFMSRSRKKQEKKRKEMLSQLGKGDKIITIGGIVGTIVEARDTEVVVKVSDNTRMTMARWAIRNAGEEVQDDKKSDTQEEQK
jgi:preprotein translocase subunit YajC